MFADSLNAPRGIILGLALFGIVSPVSLFGEPWQPAEWPVLRHYDGDHLLRIALPLGGIGTGTVSLGGRGELRDWEIMNRPARGYSTLVPGNDAPFFAIFVRTADGQTVTKALLGPIDASEYQHFEGRPVNHHGLPRFHDASFDAAYPFGQSNLSDPSLPISVRVRAFNPMIPGDADDSSLPIAILSYEVTNHSTSGVTVSVCGSLRNFIGRDGSRTEQNWKGEWEPQGALRNRNTFRVTPSLRGIYFDSEGVDPKDPSWGTMALVTEERSGVTFRTSSVKNDWQGSLLDFWDDFSRDGLLTEKAQESDDDPMASLAVRKLIPAGATRSFTFFLTWHFPNRRAWSVFTPPSAKDPIVGNYYTLQYADAWDAALRIVPRMTTLEERTLLFARAVCKSDAPAPIREAALFNLATLRSQTVFRIPSGHLMAWEGVMADTGSCFGSCTHVWNYEMATALLYGDLARTMRDVEFNYATDERGKMSYRVVLPLSKAREWNQEAADGQMGCIVKFYRDWQLCGDATFLRTYWPRVRSALAYAWKPGGWDANQDGVMEGAQSNTMDVEYFGPNPQMGFWYLAALKAGSRMAAAVGDREFAAHCEALFTNGSAYIDQHLFNGEYFEQIITDPKTHAFVDWSKQPPESLPPYQLGRGCLVDQLVGQTLANLCGLGSLSNEENQRTTIHSIMRYNFLPSFADHFNNMRSYVIGDEAGLVMASWPHGRLKVPFPYFAESMTGFEYTAAVGMLQAGDDTDAITVITAIRDRFDGRKRNPFDEPECGYHYGRSLASWNALVAWSGFQYSAVDRTISFGSRRGYHFWSNGSAWGTFELRGDGADLHVLSGSLIADKLCIKGHTDIAVPSGRLPTGSTLPVVFK